MSFLKTGAMSWSFLYSTRHIACTWYSLRLDGLEFHSKITAVFIKEMAITLEEMFVQLCKISMVSFAQPSSGRLSITAYAQDFRKTDFIT
jgi:hypothetical protein